MDTRKVIIQVDGKTRASIDVAASTSEVDVVRVVEAFARTDEDIVTAIAGRPVARVVHGPGIFNIVTA